MEDIGLPHHASEDSMQNKRKAGTIYVVDLTLKPPRMSFHKDYRKPSIFGKAPLGRPKKNWLAEEGRQAT